MSERRKAYELGVSAAVLFAAAGLAGSAWAQPQGSQVVRGDVTISTNGALTQIRASNNSIINHQSFNIASGNSVQFIQPTSDARVLNRITGGSPTAIDGTLTANGRVYMVNPAGVMFGSGAIINANAIIAAAGNMSDRDFLRGVDRFTNLTGEVINAGTINAGDVLLAGASVSNTGVIQANRSAVLVSGDNVMVRQSGSSNVYVKVGSVSGGQSVQRTGSRLGAGDALGQTLGVQHQTSSTGSVAARSITLESSGSTSVAGVLDASSMQREGGQIRVLGEGVRLEGALIDARGAQGGTILIGGDFQGQGGVRLSNATTIDSASTIDASARRDGDGGTVIVWSEGRTSFDGMIRAKGGSQRGDGGFIEVSGRATLDYSGFSQASATNGTPGELLLDPKNITISSTGSNSLSGLSYADDPSGDSTVLTTLITSTLDGGTSVTMRANNDITLADSLNAAGGGAGGAVLTLTAGRRITFNAGTSMSLGNHTLVLFANDTVGITGGGTQANRDAGQGGMELGPITTTGDISLLTRPTSGALAVGDIILNNITANRLTINSGGGTVSQSAGTGLTVTDLVLRSPTSNTDFQLYDFSQARNSVENIAADVTGTISFRNDRNLRIDALGGVSGMAATQQITLDANGTVTQTHAVVTPSLTVQTRQDGVGTGINLSNVDNDVDELVMNSATFTVPGTGARNMTFRDIDNVGLAEVTTDGVASITAGGAVTQLPSAFIGAQTGLFIITRNNAGAAIDLDATNGQNFSNNVSFLTLNGIGNAPVNAAIDYRSSIAFNVGECTTLGAINLTSPGSISQIGGSVITAGQLNATTLSNGTAFISLDGDNRVSSFRGRARNASDSADASGSVTIRSADGFTDAGTRTGTTYSIFTSGDVLVAAGGIAAGALEVTTFGDLAVNLNSNNNAVGSVRFESRNSTDTGPGDASFTFGQNNGYTIASLIGLGCADLRTGANATITQSGVIDLGGLALRTGNWTLTNTSNRVFELAASGSANINLFSSSGLTVTTVCGVTGVQTSGFTRVVANGPITQDAGIVTGHLIARTILPGADIALNNTGNDVDQLTLESRNANNTAFSDGELQFRDADGFSVLRLGTTGISTLNTNGTVDQTGANSPILTNGLNLLSTAGTGNFSLTNTGNIFSQLAGDVASANVFSAGNVNVSTLGATSGFNATSFLRIVSNGAVTQSSGITGDLLVVRTTSDAGRAITLASGDNNMARVNFQTRNSANSAFTNADVQYRDSSGFSVISLGTLGNSSLQAGGVVDQAGASLPITVGAMRTLGTLGQYTFDNTANSIPNFAGTGERINFFSTTPVNFGTVLGTNGVNVSNFLRVQAQGGISQTQPIFGNLLVGRTLSDTLVQILLTNPANNFNQVNFQSKNAANNAIGGGRIVYADATGYSVVSLGTTEQAILRGEGPVNQAGASLPITVGQGLRLLGSGSFTLNNTGNSIPALAGSAGRTEIFTTSAFRVTQLGVASGYQSSDDFIITAGGAITQDRFLRGINLQAKTLNNAGANILLTGPGNNFSGTRQLRARNAADSADVPATLQYVQ